MRARVKTSRIPELVGMEVEIQDVKAAVPSRKCGRTFQANLKAFYEVEGLSHSNSLDFCLENGCMHIGGDWEIIEEEDAQ